MCIGVDVYIRFSLFLPRFYFSSVDIVSKLSMMICLSIIPVVIFFYNLSQRFCCYFFLSSFGFVRVVCSVYSFSFFLFIRLCL